MVVSFRGCRKSQFLSPRGGWVQVQCVRRPRRICGARAPLASLAATWYAARAGRVPHIFHIPTSLSVVAELE